MIVKEIDLSGQDLSNYKIIGKLGKGGMATVYKAHELSLNRVVALKVLSSQLSEDADYIKRFQREAQAAAQLNHPNIVQVFAIGEENGIHYFAMEFIKGRSLGDIRKEEGLMPQERSAAIIKQVADALGDAHRVGLVHRDVKPSNIMIDELGRAKVTDFGIAYVSNAQTKLTRDGSIIGTPEYLSPEQCEGKPVDQRSDIYSLGVTLYELLTGKTPYEADTPVSMLMKIVRGDFPPIEQVNPNVNPSLRAIVNRMMETDPEKRFQSMGEVIKALTDYEKTLSEPAAAPQDQKERMTITYQEIDAQVAKKEPGKSSKWSAVIVALIIVVLVGGAFAAKTFYFDKKAASSSDTSPEVKTSTAAEPGQQPAGTPSTAMGAVTDEGQTQETPGPGTEEGTTPSGTVMGSMSTSDSSVPGSTGGASKTQGTTLPAEQGGVPVSTSVSNSKTAASTGNTTSSSKTAASTMAGPAANTCIITLYGDDNKGDFIAPYVEEALAKKKFRIVDEPAANKNLSSVARNQIILMVKDMGSTALNYYGNTTEEFSVQITMKLVDTETKKVLSGPVIRIVKYTSLNAQENIKEAVKEMLSGFKLK